MRENVSGVRRSRSKRLKEQQWKEEYTMAFDNKILEWDEVGSVE